ncbi:MAG: hypothetical protein QOF51_1837, partial [Chloroflexota bacterium]|nr:hypothetical protein [Chloroflexota bacterium]
MEPRGSSEFGGPDWAATAREGERPPTSGEVTSTAVSA